MRPSTVQEIEQAIAQLTPKELAELYSWLDRYDPQPIDTQLHRDLEAGRLDRAISEALGEEESSHIRPL